MTERKKIVWKYDQQASNMCMYINHDESKKCELEKQFKFKLERYKDSETHEESLKITNYKNDNENGTIVTSVVDLEKDIVKFKRYGVVLGDTYFRDLAKQIELVYLQIPEQAVTLAANDERMSGLLSQIIDYIEEFPDTKANEFCYIPVQIFNDLAKDNGYYEHEIKSLRKALSDAGFIRVDSGRYAILKRMKDKPERVLAFVKSKLMEIKNESDINE